MKKLKLNFLALLAILFAFSACNDDDEEVLPDPIVGVWVLEQISLSNIQPTEYSQFYAGDYDPTVFQIIAQEIEIFEDGTFEFLINDGLISTQEGEWELDGSTLFIEFEDGDEFEFDFDEEELEISRSYTSNLPVEDLNNPDETVTLTLTVTNIYEKE